MTILENTVCAVVARHLSKTKEVVREAAEDSLKETGNGVIDFEALS